MQILNVQQLKKEFGDEILFENVSFSINDNDRLALIGPNGNGKSTLIKILLGQIDKTSGDVSFAKGTTIGYLSQDVISNVDNTLNDEVLSVFNDLILQEKNDPIAERITFGSNISIAGFITAISVKPKPKALLIIVPKLPIFIGFTKTKCLLFLFKFIEYLLNIAAT